MIQQPTINKLMIQPLVVASILDHYQRRNASQPRVIGALLGSVKFHAALDVSEAVSTPSIEISISHSLAIPHQEQADIAVGKDVMSQLLELHSQVNKEEVLLGWYGTKLPDTNEIFTEKTLLLNDFFSVDVQKNSAFKHKVPCVFVQVDPLNYAEKCVGVQAFVSEVLALDFESLELESNEPGEVEVNADEKQITSEVLDNNIVACFKDIPITLGELSDLEVMALNSFDCSVGLHHGLGHKKEKKGEKQNEMEELVSLISGVLEKLSKKSAAGDMEEDLFRKLGALTSRLPQIDPTTFATSYNKSLHDLLMVAYLSNLTRTQLALSAKLN